MPASLHYSRLTAASWSATSSKSGYTASNAGSTGIARPWASNATGTQQLIGDLSTTQTIRAIALQSCPLSTADIRVDGSATPTTSRGAIVPAVAGHGIYRGSLAMNVSARYVSAYWTGPTLLGGTAGAYSREPLAYEVGTLYAFGSTLTLPSEPLLDSEVEFQFPQTVERLPNGQQVTVSRGAPAAEITLRFRPSASQDVEQIARIARGSVCWLDLGIASRPDLQWPVRFIDDAHSRQWRGGLDSVTLRFREVT